jgi:hypothetical protein
MPVTLSNIFHDDFLVCVQAWGGFDNRDLLFQVQNALVVDCFDKLRSCSGQMKLPDQNIRLRDNYSTIVNAMLRDDIITEKEKGKFFISFKNQQNPKILGDIKFGEAIRSKYEAIKKSLNDIHELLPNEPPSGKEWNDVFNDIIYHLYIQSLVSVSTCSCPFCRRIVSAN